LAPYTIIKNVKKLHPASFLFLQNEKITEKEYWDFNPTIKENKTEKQWLIEFKGLLADSVKIRLMADVPLGAFLSGGIDSTSVVSLMKNQNVDKIKTFSIGFKEPSYSELNYASMAANNLKTEHQDLIVRPDIEKILPEIVWMNDEPLADTSVIPMYFLSEMTRKKVTVALSGECGYETYLADKIFPYFQKFPLGFFFGNIITKLLPTTFGKISLDYKIKQFVRAKDFSREKAHYFWRVIFSDEEKEKLFKHDFYNKIKIKDAYEYFRPYFEKHKTGDFLDRAMYVDIKTWLVDDILVKVDRTSMGNSLETRAPFLDYRLVELLSKVPVNLKLKRLKKKYLLKKLMKGHIPDEIINRPKSGFNAPVPIWLKGELKNMLLKQLSKENLDKVGCFNYNFVQLLLNEYLSGKKDNSLKLWAILNFVLWNKIFLENKKIY
jgi:asparagine synthase (glutamine-hydrolysing)